MPSAQLMHVFFFVNRKKEGFVSVSGIKREKYPA
jgi:hypothetical protein